MSASMRHAVSPRRVAGALISPKVNHSLGSVLHTPEVKHRTPLVAPSPSLSPFAAPPSRNSPDILPLSSWSTLRSSPALSPSIAHALPASSGSKESSEVLRVKAPKGVTSRRKLPWSESGKCLTPASFKVTGSAVRPVDILDGIHEFEPLSFDTPDRAKALKQVKLKSTQLCVLGKGSFGTVIAATYHGNVVAAKIINHSLGAKRQLKNEMHSVKLNHPNIVSIFKVIQCDDDFDGIVLMERVPGCSLQKVIDRGLLKDNVFQRFRYSIQLGSALAYCHEHGLLHLDVKPQNVLVDVFNDTCKLCDFGCSFKVGEDGFSVQGTVGYVAPEVLEGKAPSTASDIYSLGITMWQLLSGDTPYNGERGHAIIYKVVASGYRPYTPHISSPEDEDFLNLVKKCWSEIPECRPSIQQVIKELTEVYPDAK